MNLTRFDEVATMSSNEIAVVTGKRHDNVLRDIKKVLDEAGISESKFKRSYLSEQNKELPCYHVPIEVAFTLILSYKNKDCNLQLVTKLCGDSKNLAAIVSALRDFDFSEVPEEMFVYVARNTDTGNIKIGLSKQPEERIKQLQVGCDGKLELLGCIPAPNRYKDETAYHRKFISSNIHSEWFTSDAAEIILN